MNITRAYKNLLLAVGAAAAPALAAGAMLLQAPASSRAPVPAAKAQFFEQKVRPLLLKECGSCHGPTSQQGGLRLDAREHFQKGGGRGSLLPKSAGEKGLLLHAVSYQDKALQMPPTRALTAEQVSVLTQWVRMGAPFPEYPKEPKETKPLWSLQPVRRPAPPVVKNAAWARGPIDRFILRDLEKRGMVPAPPADRRELLRRVTFDLVGLPPTPEETAAFLADRSANAYEKVVDRLLASPRHGERWARWWLDLARYADTDGYERDEEKKFSWRYRDYVINAFSRDKPFDRFVREQLAGDELPDRSVESVIATGFLRLGPWNDEPNDPLDYKYERLDELVHATTTAFLSLTVRCARCHDHKFDAIPQKDYYAVANAFNAGYIEPADKKLQGGPPPELIGIDALAFTDRGRDIPPMRLLHSGDPRRPTETVPPGFLTAVKGPPSAMSPPPANAATTRRRLQLAEWIAHPKNPLTARVFVNRLWQHHFGEGLSRTPNNFGIKGDEPTHPELLDWLASDFVANGWRIKRMHRQMVLSSAYRMASRHPLQARYAETDAGNRLLWRMNRRRMDADALWDSMLAVSGELNLKEGGPGFVPTVTREALEGLSRKGEEWKPSPPAEQRRRSIYMFLKRALIPPIMTVFDFSDTTQPLEQRNVTIGSPQALALMNNPLVTARAEALARRVEAEAGADPARRVERAWLLTLGRKPSEPERSAALRHLRSVQPKPEESVRAEVPAEGRRLWLRADQGVATDGAGRVAEWKVAGGGFTAAQPGEAARPLLVKDALNGRPAVRFDGRGTWLGIPEQVLTSQRFTVIAVVNDTSSGGGLREIFSNWNGGAGNSTTSVFLGLTDAGTVRLSDGFPSLGELAEPAKHFVLTATAEASGISVHQNREEAARVATPLTKRNLSGPYVIGQQGNIMGEYWRGDIAELLVWDRPLSEAEREGVWEALSARYGIAKRARRADPALASLCHVLLNTNEFLFID
jgi:cytochrome c553